MRVELAAAIGVRGPLATVAQSVNKPGVSNGAEMMRMILLAATVTATVWATGAARAEVPLAGSFTASQACPALQSIRQQANPGRVMTEPGRAYPVTAKNKDDATYFLITVEGAEPRQRWVAAGCGRTDAASAAVATPAAAPGGGTRATHVLALGWEPAFCREHPDKAECARETAQSFEATHLSLHGLWPQLRGRAYCGVDRAVAQAGRAHDWGRLPAPAIGPATRQRLAAIMPGTQSGLERHEWIVHGTCYGASADQYFNRAASLAEQVNASGVRDVFVQHTGGPVTAGDIRAAFDQAFGAGAGARVSVSCPGRDATRRVGEIVISLAGDVTGEAPLAELIRAAAPVPPGCPSGLVERAVR